MYEEFTKKATQTESLAVVCESWNTWLNSKSAFFPGWYKTLGTDKGMRKSWWVRGCLPCPWVVSGCDLSRRPSAQELPPVCVPGAVFVYVRRPGSESYCVICRGRVLLSPVYFRLRIPRLVQIAVPVALQLSFRFLPLSLDFLHKRGGYVLGNWFVR